MSHIKARPTKRDGAGERDPGARTALYDVAMALHANVADREAGKERVFLTAEWRDLVMLNYEVEPRLLREYVPRGTELDSFGGKTLVSLVGFRFLRTKFFGWLPLPFHSNFDEVNLRFYVRRPAVDGDRRGVVFIQEIVPKRAVALLARVAYGENYSRFPMRHRVTSNGTSKTAEYEWRLHSGWARLHAEGAGEPDLSHRLIRQDEGRTTREPFLPADGSIEQFITEHYWGYSTQRDGGSVEYHVTHPQWRVWKTASGGFEGDGAEIYGSALGAALQRPPDSAFIAEGSPVVVFTGRRIA
ncbi:MAG: DUF2071 domain-containing protein [Candidatus Acidiferrales bacterium]